MTKLNTYIGTDISSYCSGLIDTGYSRVPETTNTKKAGLNEKIQAHLRLLESSEQVIRELIKSSEIMNISAPMLLHPDLHKRNIFVSDEDPSLVTAVIDWQSAGIEPVFSFANETPDMVKDPLIDTPLLEDGSDTSPKQSSCHQENNSKEVISINEQTYEVAMRGWIPKLHDARALDEVLLRPIRYCHTSWRDGAAALRQELIELSQVWEKLGLPGSCPYQPTAVELDQHIKEWEDFQSLQTLKLFLIRSINSNTDGWVDPETWEAAKDANNAFLEEWLKTAAQSEDPNMNIERGRTLWPFDTNIV